MLHYLDDAIYPGWVLFSKTINEPGTEKDKTYSKGQEAL